MDYIYREIEAPIREALSRGKSVLLIGPRQVGKSTLIANLNPDETLSLARPALRQQYERDIDSFTQTIEAMQTQAESMPLVAIDEIQKVPELMDAVQDLIDRQVAQFILTGSSARKLRHGKHINWLPGRVISFYMDPLQLSELVPEYLNLNDLLIYGSLPAVVLEPNKKNKEQDLESYVTTYLEEEVRQEALVRNMGHFGQFLQLASAESGQITNFNKLSQDIGIAQTTIKNYYDILEDCLIATRIEPITQSKFRRRLSKTPKYLWFDLGLRRVAAHEGEKLSDSTMGRVFEQFVGLELIRLTRLISNRIDIKFWRDLGGAEVDWVICANKVIPIEVKWSNKPSAKHCKHLHQFIQEYELNRGYLICQIDRPQKIDDKIIAISWRDINNTIKDELA